MNKQVFDYFKKGFSLANKSWDLFLFILFLYLLTSFPNLLGDSSTKTILQVIGFLPVYIISLGFSFSLPIFLVDRQQGRFSSNLSNLLSTTLANAKRLILPSILILICLFIVGVLSFLLVVQLVYGGNFNFMENTPTSGLNTWSLVFALVAGFFSFGAFTSIYFSLERNGFFSSIKKSIAFSFKNLNFIIILFIINVFIYLISTLLLNNYQNLYQLFISGVISSYQFLLIIAASLILYQSHGGVSTLTSSVSSSKKIEEIELQTEDERYKKFLAPNEKIVKVFDYANSQFIWDLVIGILLIPLLFFGLIWILIAIYRKLTLRYLVTDRRVIVKKGLIGQSTVSADYSKVTDVTVTQGILGRLLLHTGTIIVNTAGTDVAELELKWIQDPFEAKNAIYNQLHKK